MLHSWVTSLILSKLKFEMQANSCKYMSGLNMKGKQMSAKDLHFPI